MRLKDKVAVVTGSARNIGKACLMALSREGAKVVVNARSRDKVDEVVREIRSSGREAVPNYDSVGTKEGVEGLIKTAVDSFGKIDILVNNAGIITWNWIHEMPDEDWEAVITTNLTAVFRCTKLALPSMMAQQWGRIINITAHAGLEGSVMRAHYAAAKGGIIALTKSIAKEYGKYNITANAIAPFAKTWKDEGETVAQAQDRAIYAQEVPKEVVGPAMNKLVVPKIGGPEDIAPAVVFFASEDAWYITGQVISVGGGMWM